MGSPLATRSDLVTGDIVSHRIRGQICCPVLRLWVVVCVLTLGGCAADGPANSRQQTQREATLGSLWRGKTHDLLLKGLGPPKMAMTVPGERPIPTMALVYGVNEATQCVDAFTMVKNDATGLWLVADYFCR